MLIGITGASGYVGSKVAEYARRAGHDVVALGRTPPDGDARFVRFALRDGVAADVLADLDALVHLAYDFGPTSWEAIRAVNVEGTRRLFEAAGAAGVDVVHVSSLSAFEGTRSNYGRAKLATERAAFDRGFAVVRSGLVYGRALGSVVGGLRSLVGLSPVVPVPAGGPHVHYLCHYADLAELLVRCCAGDVAADAPVVAAAGTGRSFREILRTLAEHGGRRVRLVPVPAAVPYYGLRVAEAVGLDLGLRSDSVVGLVHPNPDPDFGPTGRSGVEFREFSVESLDEGLPADVGDV